jgi:Helicase HerA, central domain/TraM recognition site of TraD and TraG
MIDHLPIGTKDDNFFQDSPPAFTIPPETRRKHMAIFGATGAGKSTLLRNMIAWDIASGLGVTVVDPHGQLIEDILENHIPRHRTNDVVYCNPKDQTRAFALNLLDSARPEQRGLVVANVISIFRTIWGESFGPRMEDILRNSLHALIEQPTPVSLLALPKLLTDDGYRASVLERVNDPVVLHFFRSTYDRWTPAFREEAISPVLNKARAFLTDPLLRSVIGQARSSIDFRWMMDHRKIFLCDLSKGAIGGDSAQLLGSLVVIKEKLAALTRQDIPEAERVPHVLYVEEAQNFIADFESILQETRKFALTMVIATQTIAQLSKESSSAVFGNCATLVSFRVGALDAERLNEEFAAIFPSSNLQDLQDFKVYVRTLATDGAGVGHPSGPHLVSAYPPFARAARSAQPAKVTTASNERYTKDREVVEKRIKRFLSHQTMTN